MIRDVVIVGAGPVGATLALALREADLDILVIDARTSGATTRADRSLALSHGARLIYERLGVWSALAAMPGAVTPITAIDVSQAHGFGSVRLEAAEHGLPALGYVVSYRALQQVLDDALHATPIEVQFGATAREVTGSTDRARIDVTGEAAGTIEARLAVIADGAASSARGIERRRHEYGQAAVVATVSLAAPHGGVAYERFTPDGPIALLPQRDEYGLVWTRPPADAARLLLLDEQAFIASLAERFGSRVRGFAHVRERRSFPLTLEVASDTTARHVAVIGNAAQALHPIGGQGFNLGLRDAYELARIVVDARYGDVGSPAMLDRYRRRRSVDRRAGIAFTHGLVQLFGNDRPWLHVPRGMGLMLLDAMPAVKRTFTRSMLYGLRL